MSLDAALQRMWYAQRPTLASRLLSPLSWLFAALVGMRRRLYRAGWLRSFDVGVPVIVVGNITAGGTGKTPLTIWLAGEIARRGRRVAIVLRGYGGGSQHWPRDVDSSTPWQEVGDEAVLLASRTDAIVVAGPDRVQAARRAVERGAQVVICDDGLQHYRLRRQAEVSVIDAARRFGNGRLLPAGPLREPVARLREVTASVLLHKAGANVSATSATDSTHIVVNAMLRSATHAESGEVRALTTFAGQRVHAVAGIGHPQTFFAGLRTFGIDVIEHALPDHASIARSDIDFADDVAVLMTEKDAVKCRALVDRRHWVVPLDVDVGPEAAARIVALLEQAIG